MTMPPQPAPTGRIDPPQPAVSVNGTAPGPGEAECVDCVTPGERALAILGLLIGFGIAAMATDVLTGYKLSRAFGLGRKEEPASVDESGS